jgi:CrcB protein
VFRAYGGYHPLVPELPVDPDIDVHVPEQRTELDLGVLAAIAAGGVVGAEARYVISLALPHPWATFAINAAGCLLIGVLMVCITEIWTAHRLVRPFVGVGILGGFTTFSTYALDIVTLAQHQAAVFALLYLILTPIAAVLAAWIGVSATRLVTRR